MWYSQTAGRLKRGKLYSTVKWVTEVIKFNFANPLFDLDTERRTQKSRPSDPLYFSSTFCIMWALHLNKIPNRLVVYPIRPTFLWLLCLLHVSLWLTDEAANQRRAGREFARTLETVWWISTTMIRPLREHSSVGLWLSQERGWKMYYKRCRRSQYR